MKEIKIGDLLEFEAMDNNSYISKYTGTVEWDERNKRFVVRYTLSQYFPFSRIVSWKKL